MIYLLDTDHVRFFSQGTREGANLQARILKIAPDDYGTTIISYEEQCRGWLSEINDAETPQQRIFAYDRLKRTLDFFSRIAVVAYDAEADAQFVALKAVLKNKVGTKDLRIASIALANNATVLTRNSRDFGRVPGLLFADWTT